MAVCGHCLGDCVECLPYCMSCWRNVFGVTLAQSKIHGKGIIATASFFPGDAIIPYSGTVMSEAETAQKYPHGHDYLMSGPHGTEGEWPQFYIDPTEDSDGSRHLGSFVNHSPTPNAVVLFKKHDHTFPLWIVATQHIRPNDEIVIYYGCRYWTDSEIIQTCEQKKNNTCSAI